MTDVAGVETLDEYLAAHAGEDYHGLFLCRQDGDGPEFEEIHLRSDIRSHYTDEDREAMTREAVLRALEQGYLETLYQLGDHRFTIEYFDHAALLFIAVSTTEAIVIGLQADPELNHVAIAEHCLDVLHDR